VVYPLLFPTHNATIFLTLVMSNDTNYRISQTRDWSSGRTSAGSGSEDLASVGCRSFPRVKVKVRAALLIWTGYRVQVGIPIRHTVAPEVTLRDEAPNRCRPPKTILWLLSEVSRRVHLTRPHPDLLPLADLPAIPTLFRLVL
jgi:hypothetical protein